MTTTARPVTVISSSPARLEQVCSPGARALIEARTTPVWNETGAELSAADLAHRLADAEILLTSWGTVPITDAMLDAAPRLRVIAHAAGSMKTLVPESVFDRGIAVVSGVGALAEPVAEYCLAVLLSLLRQLPDFDRELRQGIWSQFARRGRSLRQRRIGLVSASTTARAFLRLLAPFEPIVTVYDPYLDTEAASALGVRLGSLEDVMACDIVSVHAPVTPKTRGLITRAHLASCADGTVFLQTSRAAVADQQALFDELASGRLVGAMDVYDDEPVELPEAVRRSPHALFTPHVAADTVEGRLRLMESVVEIALAWLDTGEERPGIVTKAAWEITA